MALLRRLSTGISYTPRGAFNQRVQLIQNTTRNDDGEFTTSTFATVWAAISILAGRDLERAQLVTPEVTHKVVVSYMPGLSSGIRIILTDGRNFEIMAIEDPDERKVELRLLCRERSDGVE